MKKKPITFNDLARVGANPEGVSLEEHGETPVPDEVFKRLPLDIVTLLMERLGPRRLPTHRLQGAIVDGVASEDLVFLWPNRFVQGNLNVIVGDPGAGKSYMTLDMVARITRGAPWPDGSGTAAKGNALILSGEDSLADTIRPRLEKHDADLSRVKVIEKVELPSGTEVPLRLLDHMTAVEEEIRRTRPRVLIVDPITSFMGVKDDYRMTDVRAVLTPLKQVAEVYGTTMILVTHPNKKGDQPPIYRPSGSLGYVAAARTVWMVGLDPDNDERRVLSPVKYNILKNPTSLAFSIVSGPDEAHGTVTWEEQPLSFEPGDLLAGKPEREPGALSRALDFLRETLSNGPIPSRELSEAADRRRISARTLKEARKKLGVEAVLIKTGPGKEWWSWWPGHGPRPGL